MVLYIPGFFQMLFFSNIISTISRFLLSMIMIRMKKQVFYVIHQENKEGLLQSLDIYQTGKNIWKFKLPKT